MTPIKTIERNGLKINLFQDQDAESPRQWDNLGKLALFSRRVNRDYNNPGDEHSFTPLELREFIRDTNAVWLPVFFHNGYQPSLSVDVIDMVTQKVAPFPQDEEELCSQWDDSNQIGMIFITSEQLVKEFGADTSEIREKAIASFQSQIETLNQYLSGEVYGYEILKPNTCTECEHTKNEPIDSCWGFYGFEECEKEAISAAGFSATK